MGAGACPRSDVDGDDLQDFPKFLLNAAFEQKRVESVVSVVGGLLFAPR